MPAPFSHLILCLFLVGLYKFFIYSGYSLFIYLFSPVREVSLSFLVLRINLAELGFWVLHWSEKPNPTSSPHSSSSSRASCSAGAAATTMQMDRPRRHFQQTGKYSLCRQSQDLLARDWVLRPQPDKQSCRKCGDALQRAEHRPPLRRQACWAADGTTARHLLGHQPRAEGERHSTSGSVPSWAPVPISCTSLRISVAPWRLHWRCLTLKRAPWAGMVTSQWAVASA